MELQTCKQQMSNNLKEMDETTADKIREIDQKMRETMQKVHDADEQVSWNLIFLGCYIFLYECLSVYMFRLNIFISQTFNNNEL